MPVNVPAPTLPVTDRRPLNQPRGGIEIVMQVHHAHRLAELTGKAALYGGYGIIVAEGDILQQPAALGASGAHNAHIAQRGSLLTCGGNNILGVKAKAFK